MISGPFHLLDLNNLPFPKQTKPITPQVWNSNYSSLSSIPRASLWK